MGTDLQRFRKRIFKAIIAKKGFLSCEYCGSRLTCNFKQKAGTPHPRNLATIDHVVPVSKGGGRLDEANVIVCCYACNVDKGNLDHEAFARKQEVAAGELLDKAARIRNAWWRKVEAMRANGIQCDMRLPEGKADNVDSVEVGDAIG